MRRRPQRIVGLRTLAITAIVIVVIVVIFREFDLFSG
jgi:hypothetical protein